MLNGNLEISPEPLPGRYTLQRTMKVEALNQKPTLLGKALLETLPSLSYGNLAGLDQYFLQALFGMADSLDL